MTTDPFFFGYGSLVNTATHAYGPAFPARIRGWRRAWRRSAARPLAFLTAVRDPASEIAGLIAPVPGADWAALDTREYCYARHPVDQIDHDASAGVAVQVYALPDHDAAPPTDENPILLSYLDVVLQGYLHRFGIDGARAFIATTDGWHAPVIDDRAGPRYPRAQRLSADETAFVDAALRELGVTPRAA
jgi:hypothetical protein